VSVVFIQLTPHIISLGCHIIGLGYVKTADSNNVALQIGQPQPNHRTSNNGAARALVKL
jgi:hypothetical protein